MLRRWNIEIAPIRDTLDSGLINHESMNHLLNAMIIEAVLCFAMVDHWLWTSPWRNGLFSPPKIWVSLLVYEKTICFSECRLLQCRYCIESFDTVGESLFWSSKKTTSPGIPTSIHSVSYSKNLSGAEKKTPRTLNLVMIFSVVKFPGARHWWASRQECEFESRRA